MNWLPHLTVWTLSTLSLNGQQKVAGDENAPAPATSKIAAVEAADEFLATLRTATEINFGECMPDPQAHPELFERERKKAVENQMAGAIAGHAIYDFDPSWGFLDELRDALSEPKIIAALSEDQAKAPFIPENFVSWKSGGSTFHALISTRLKQVLFIHGEKRHLRYALTQEGFAALDRFCRQRFLRPDDLKDSKPFVDSLASDLHVLLYEGTPGRNVRSNPQAARERGIIRLRGFDFYKGGAPVLDLRPLRTLLATEGTIIEWRGTKACGGFHPDFCLTWGEGNEQVVLLICLTCHEVLIEKNSISLLYDLGDAPYKSLKEELEKFRPAAK